MDVDRAAQSLDAVGEACQAGTARWIGPADSVVAERQQQAAAARSERHLHARGLRVLDRVGQCLGDGVVGGDLDRLGQPPVELACRGPPGRRTGGPASSVPGAARLGQDRRVQPAGDLPQFLQHPVQSRRLSASSCSLLAGSGRPTASAARSSRARRDQALLGAVVQVALDAAAGGIGGGHDPRARGGQRRLGFGVGDRGASQLGEPGQPRFCARWQRRSARDATNMTPHSRPSTLTGAPTAARRPDPAGERGVWPEASA